MLLEDLHSASSPLQSSGPHLCASFLAAICVPKCSPKCLRASSWSPQGHPAAISCPPEPRRLRAASGPPQGRLTALCTPPRHSAFAPLTQRVPLGVPSPPRGAAGIPPPLSIARWPLRPRLTPPCPPVPPRHLLAPKQRAGIEGSGRKETAHPACSERLCE